MVWFFIKKQIPQTYKPIIIMLFLGGGLQGLIGWLMVKSGLVDRLHVSQYRLALHLGFALILYYFVLHTAIRLWQRSFFSLPKLSPALVVTFLVFLQIISGAFTAGTHAGYTYNTYPLMDNQIIPDGLFESGIMAMFDDILTVQFIHRHFALVVLITAFYAVFLEIKRKNFFDASLLFLSIFLQIALGIMTLISVAPVAHIELAAFHQFFAVVTLSICCYLNARIFLYDFSINTPKLP
jgi:cytochrome c oxidase assembly protein subunit 15